MLVVAPLVRALVVAGGARPRRARRRWDDYRAAVARGPARRATLVVAPTARDAGDARRALRRRAPAARDPERPRRARPCAGAEGAVRARRRAGSGTRRRTSPRSTRVAPRLPWPVRVAGATRSRPSGRAAAMQLLGRALAATSWRVRSRAPRSTRCPRATSRSACRSLEAAPRRLRARARRHPEPARGLGRRRALRRARRRRRRSRRALQRADRRRRRRALAAARPRRARSRYTPERMAERRTSTAVRRQLARRAAPEPQAAACSVVALLPLAGLRLEPRQRALPARRRAASCSRAATTVDVYEPRDALERGEPRARARRGGARRVSRTPIPGCGSRRYDLGDARPRRARSTAPTWCSSTSGTTRRWSRRIGEHRARGGGYRLLFHDTHHRAVTDAGGAWRATTSRDYDGVLAFGDVIRDLYLARGWARARLDLARGGRHARLPAAAGEPREGDLVWIGNWGDDERDGRAARVPARAGRRRSACARRPRRALSAARAGARCADAGIAYGGWLPNYEVPRRLRAPRRDGARAAAAVRRGAARASRRSALRGAGLRHPAGVRALGRREGLFAPGATSSSRATAPRCASTCARARATRRLRARSPSTAASTILARHTCAHRVDELLAIAELGLARHARRPSAHEDRVLRLEPGLGVLERRRDLLPRHRAGAARARAPRHVLRARRLRAPAAPRHRRSGLGEASSSTRPTARTRCAIVEQARGADVVVKASGVGVFDELLEAAVLELQAPARAVVLGRRRAGDARRALRGRPGRPVSRADPALRPRAHLRRRRRRSSTRYRALGARDCVPIYNALDPDTHHPVDAGAALRRRPGASSATGCPTARRASRSSSCARPRCCPSGAFLLGGSGWERQAAAAERALRSATSTRATTTPSTARRSRCSTSAARAWRATASRRRRACSRRPAPAPA